MPVLSARSKRELAGCHPELRRLFEAVAEELGVELICGHRGKLAQNEAYARGASKVPWPQSRHNSKPSEAVDVIPSEIIQGTKIAWNDTAAFKRLAEVVKTTALKLGIEITWGGDWRMRDLVHFELAKD